MKYSVQLILLVLSLSCIRPTYGQSFDSLHRLPDFSISVYYSNGFEARAMAIAKRTDAATRYHAQLLGFQPEVTLLVLSKEDWNKYTSFPVYGMPHYTNAHTLIVASSDNDLWQSFVPPLNVLPVATAEQLKKAYGLSTGTLSMQPFFDLLALHELGHAFHLQRGLNMQRKWMGELFCNIFLHTYIAENEPHLLPALTAFPEMVVTAGSAGYTFTSLNDLEKNYDLVGKNYPKNYGWYQSRLHKAAKEIYDAGGKQVISRLWKALKQEHVFPDDKDLATFLQQEVHTVAGDVVLQW